MKKISYQIKLRKDKLKKNTQNSLNKNKINKFKYEFFYVYKKNLKFIIFLVINRNRRLKTKS